MEHILRPYLDHRKNFNTFKRTEIIQSVFSDHNGTKPEINTRTIIGKSPNTCKPDNTVLNNPWINKEVSGEKKKDIGLS